MSSNSQGARWSRWRLAVASLVLVVLIPIMLAVVLASMEPTAYAPPDPEDLDVPERARVFEENFASELTRVRQQEAPWGVRIREQDINAWLWVRFPAWVAHLRGSGAFGTEPMIQATIEPRRIRLVSETLTVAFEPEVEGGVTRIHAASGSALGRLPVPEFMFEQLLGSIEIGELRGAFSAPEQAAPTTTQELLTFPSQFQLGDGRTVELIEIQLDVGEAVLVFQTIRAQP